MMRIRTNCSRLIALLVVGAFAVPAAAQTSHVDLEIDYLVESIGESDCTFIRNGKEHDAEDARDHLQMKRKRGRRYYDTTEEFIDRIASKSSWTGKKYLIRCGGDDSVPAGDWLRNRLDDYRSGSNRQRIERNGNQASR